MGQLWTQGGWDGTGVPREEVTGEDSHVRPGPRARRPSRSVILAQLLEKEKNPERHQGEKRPCWQAEKQLGEKAAFAPPALRDFPWLTLTFLLIQFLCWICTHCLKTVDRVCTSLSSWLVRGSPPKDSKSSLLAGLGQGHR